MEEKQSRAAVGRRTAAQQQRRRSQSVFQYITILFAAALLLLLYTFLMERRQYEISQVENQEQIDQLQQNSASATQRLDAIIAERDKFKEENAALKEQAERLGEELAEAQSQLDALPDAISQQEHVLEQTKRAMDWFWQIDEAYVRGRNRLCRELIAHLEDGSDGQPPLKDYLPTKSATGNGRFSPRDRYQEIYDALF